MGVKEIETHTFHGDSCIGAKRVYANNLQVDWNCPSCNISVSEDFNQTPLVSYGDYCHVFCCPECGYESLPDQRMYKLIEIREDRVLVEFSTDYNLKAYKLVTIKKEL
ncbi:hypothetical protein NVP1121O_153 [Vibrio phage 1.121.O._10N.286.46.C4]|nr:hypothetical protein NVP1121O_153 [Vibrio phage 1.121.O._10N.286.46.C4]